MANKNLQFKRQRIINLESGSYIFRSDHGGDIKYWAWVIEPVVKDRSQCYKWNKLPKSKRSSKKGDVILFDLENPPRTVSYLPILD